MKLKKLLSILLAVALVLAMTVSVSASKRFKLGEKYVIGTLEWSGTPYENEVITATTKMDVGFCTLGAQLYGSYMDSNGLGSGTRSAPGDLRVGFIASTSTSVQNGYWTSANATYVASYDGESASAIENKEWHQNR